MVPSGALVRAREGGWAVLRVADGRVRQVAIEVLDRNVDFARVGGPLAPGERLVLYPGANLRDGDRVRSRAAGDRH
jgi:HlyD family secretion protein